MGKLNQTEKELLTSVGLFVLTMALIFGLTLGVRWAFIAVLIFAAIMFLARVSNCFKELDKRKKQ